MKSAFYPLMISGLPEADIPIPGLKAYLLQGEQQQVVFMEFAEDAVVPEHAHEAQWGVVLDGMMELTIDGKLHVLRKGDSYSINAGQRHGAKIFAGYKDVTVFDQGDRYRVKNTRTQSDGR